LNVSAATSDSFWVDQWNQFRRVKQPPKDKTPPASEKQQKNSPLTPSVRILVVLQWLQHQQH